MGFFSDTHQDDEYDFLFKKRRYRYGDIPYDRQYHNAYSNRFLSHSYILQFMNEYSASDQSPLPVNQRQKYKEKVTPIIYKNIGFRNGENALKDLMKYISRTKAEHILEGKEHVYLYDSDHKSISPDQFDDVIETFSNNFEADAYEKENDYFYNLIKDKNDNKTKIDDLNFEIWRVGTKARIRNQWNREVKITEIHDNRYLKIEYPIHGELHADYIQKDEVVPTVTSEGFKIYDHQKAKSPDKMLIAADDDHYSVFKSQIHKQEKIYQKTFFI